MGKKNFLVRWEIDIKAESPERASLEALKTMRDKGQAEVVLCFDVIEINRGDPLCDNCKRRFQKRTTTVDLEDFAVCDDCGEVFKLEPEDGLTEIEDVLERIEPGGMVPSCECPECGALAYPARKMAD